LDAGTTNKPLQKRRMKIERRVRGAAPYFFDRLGAGVSRSLQQRLQPHLIPQPLSQNLDSGSGRLGGAEALPALARCWLASPGAPHAARWLEQIPI